MKFKDVIECQGNTYAVCEKPKRFSASGFVVQDGVKYKPEAIQTVPTATDRIFETIMMFSESGVKVGYFEWISDK